MSRAKRVIRERSTGESERLRVEGEEITIRIGRWQLQLRLDQAGPDRG